MEWSPQQEQALRLVSRWLASSADPYFVLGGYAGTGKTTLARHLVAGTPGRVYFAAFTGKAAHVLRRSGVEATTIHKLVYLPREKCGERLRRLEAELRQISSQHPLATVRAPRVREQISELEEAVRKERDNLRRPEFYLNCESPLWGASLVVVDEYSMVDEQVGRDLLSFGCPVLALGDPGQLPPVSGRCFFKQPDYVLTEVHRQALENPIVRLSMDVREGRGLAVGQHGESRVVPRREVTDADFWREVAGADQVLVGMNHTRRRVNQQVRMVLGREGDAPVPGDKVVCLRNSHDEGLFNGQTWRVARVTGRDFYRLTLEDDEGRRVACLAHPDYFRGGEVALDRRRRANEFDYGYALTVHKSQGSQWDHVFLLDEWEGRDREKWLYTAVTRAVERVTVVC